LESAIEAQPKPTPGKPPQPYYTQRVAREIWNIWDKLKTKDQFDANDAWKIAKGKDSLPTMYRIDSFYSAILSKWAQEGYIERIREGRGPLPAIYKIPN
jgi:hypothetical protein